MFQCGFWPLFLLRLCVMADVLERVCAYGFALLGCRSSNLRAYHEAHCTKPSINQQSTYHQKVTQAYLLNYSFVVQNHDDALTNCKLSSFWDSFATQTYLLLNTSIHRNILGIRSIVTSFKSVYFGLYSCFLWYCRVEDVWVEWMVLDVFGILSNMMSIYDIYNIQNNTMKYIPHPLITTLILLYITTTTNTQIPNNQTPTPYPTQPPQYSLTKLSYTNLTKSQSVILHSCNTQLNTNHELIPSINIHQGDSLSYPAIVRYCDQFYTVNGYHLLSFAGCAARVDCRYFVSSVRNQFTYFAEVYYQQGQLNSTAVIKKLQSRNKKVSIQQQATILIPAHYGKITSFANSFSLSLKMYAFATNKKYLIFYRIDGTLQSCINLGQNDIDLIAFPHQQQPQPAQQLKLVKLNNHLAIYTITLHKKSFLYTINTNGKNTTLKKYIIPKYNPQPNQKIQLKFNDNHWNEFYVKIQNKIYVYDQTDKINQVMPKLWYPMIEDDDQFYLATQMIVVVSYLGRQRKVGSQPIRIYYNLTSDTVAQFFIPRSQCPGITHISTSSKGQGVQIMCSFCKLSFQCYSLFSNVDPSALSKTDYTDYSKFRVPLVLISLGVVIFISVTRGKKKNNNLQDEEKQQQMFMKQLEKKDRSLYEQLKKNRKVPIQTTGKRNRGFEETNMHKQ